MNPTLPSRFSLLVAAACLAGVAPALAAETPDTENGRYTLSPSGDGMIRLDTRTGTVSNCSNSAAGWACYAVPDERAALDAEIGRLQAENEKLKAQLASREPAPRPARSRTPLPKSDKAPSTADGQRKIEIPLPSDQDMDRVMSFLERAWRRLIDMANRCRKTSRRRKDLSWRDPVRTDIAQPAVGRAASTASSASLLTVQTRGSGLCRSHRRGREIRARGECAEKAR